MPKNADAIKASFGTLVSLKLDMKPVMGWNDILTKYGEYETTMDAITAQYPKAKETANNPNITPGPAFTQFLELQQKALKLKQDLKPTVEKLEAGRQKLYDAIKLIEKTDKKKADPMRAKLQSCNTQFNAMLVSVRQTTEELGPLKPKSLPPTAPNPAPPAPTAATPKPTAPTKNQYAKTPNEYQKSPVTKK